ncbi:hypothetical protein Salat_0522200 [Sesamum alatum]|uniref:DUF4283 domain-containing protein n=1 Tax=Sesamum alatum TaxID=300844 RepID=A0AAE2CT64_9LAMI|nr:hypothetical protein Salat_0522200 [Sesamum alatum]
MEDADPVETLFDNALQIEVSDDESELTNDSTDHTKYPIVTKIISGKILNHNAIKSTLTKAWKIPSKTHVNTVSQNTLVFFLDSEDDRRRIWSQSPWSFRGNLVVTRPWYPEDALDEVDLAKTQIWVQVTGLTVVFTNKKIAEKIGKSIGKFIQINLTSENQRWRRALR